MSLVALGGEGKDRLCKIADDVVRELRDCLSPEQSTWGEQFREAHSELFDLYFKDLSEAVHTVLVRRRVK